jgi:hypothetical protein
MDKYEKAMQRLSRMSRQGKEQETRKNESLCACHGCPSFNECAGEKKEVYYCVKGKSKCITEEFGCICNACPVAQELGLMHQYYCLNGSEDDMRKF